MFLDRYRYTLELWLTRKLRESESQTFESSIEWCPYLNTITDVICTAFSHWVYTNIILPSVFDGLNILHEQIIHIYLHRVSNNKGNFDKQNRTPISYHHLNIVCTCGRPGGGRRAEICGIHELLPVHELNYIVCCVTLTHNELQLAFASSAQPPLTINIKS